MKDDKCGVYEIRNLVNNKIYIGSSKHIYTRWKEHKKMLQNGKHYNVHLQGAWDKYGEDNFRFTILEECDEQNRFSVEQSYIDKTNCCDMEFGYNIRHRAVFDKDVFEFEQKRKDSLKRSARRGEESHASKYTEEQAKTVIQMLQNPENSIQEIMDEAKVPQSFIRNIRDRNSWTYLTEGIIFPPREHYAQKGESAKLRKEDVLCIIQRLLGGEYDNHLAHEYNVYPSTIARIRTHKTWKNLSNGITFPEPKTATSQLTLKDAQEIYDLCIAGEDKHEIAKKYKITYGCVHSIYTGKSWKHVNRTIND